MLILLYPDDQSKCFPIAACTRHPTLRKLDFQSNGLEGAAGHEAIEAALDALLEASNAELDLVR